MKSAQRKLRVFLCHASQDKPAVRELYKRLKSQPWIDPWLDEENLLPGQDWDLEIYKATRDADAIIICLSKLSVAKEGYVNREIRRALDIAQEKLESEIYVIPLRLDDCIPSFEQLKKLQWADYFSPNAHERLLKSLHVRAETLKIGISGKEVVASLPLDAPSLVDEDDNLDLYRFIKLEPQENFEISYPFWIGKYPVTNMQYERFLNASDYSEASHWRGFLKFNENGIQIGRWHEEGWDWFQEQMKDPKKFLDKQRVVPEYWNDKNFGISNPENPVVGITWYEANAYCNWLLRHWNKLAEDLANPGLRPKQIRLPLDVEWSAAAGGEKPEARYPWDTAGKITKDIKEIACRANVSEANIGHTTPVNAFLRGASTRGVMDMAGNVWEWQANYRNMKEGKLSLRGGSWGYSENGARVSVRDDFHPNGRGSDLGFRAVVFPREASS